MYLFFEECESRSPTTTKMMPLHAPSNYIREHMPAQRVGPLGTTASVYLQRAARENHALEVLALATEREPFP